MKFLYYISLYTLSLILVCSCNDSNNANKEDSPINHIDDSLKLSKLEPFQLHDSILKDLEEWNSFKRFQQDIYKIGRYDTIIKEQKEIDEFRPPSIINTYQSLYYQLVSLKENVFLLSSTIPPKLLDNKSISSRIELLKTFVLRTEYLFTHTKMRVSDEVIIKLINRIFDAYNNLLKTIEKKYTRKYNQREIDLIIETLIPKDSIISDSIINSE